MRCFPAFLTLSLLPAFLWFAPQARADDEPVHVTPLDRQLSLEEAILIALERNTGVELSENNVDLSQVDVLREKGDFLPDLRASFGYEKRNSLQRAGTSTTTTTTTTGTGTTTTTSGTGAVTSSSRRWTASTSGGVTSTMTLYNGGENRASLARSRWDLAASSRDFNWTWQGTIYEAIFRYLSAVRAASQIEVEREELAAREVELDRVQNAFDANDRPITDLLQQKSVVAESRSRIAEAEQAYETALLSLKQLLLVPVDTEFTLNDPTVETLPTTERLLKQIGVGDLVDFQARADVLAQEARIIAAKENVRAAKAGFLPSVNLNGATRTSYSSLSDDSFGSQYFDDQPEYTLGVTVSVPIFNRHQTRSDVLRARLLKSQEEILLKDTMQAAATEFAQAKVDFTTSQARLSFAREEFAATDEALQALQVRYGAGEANIAELTQIQSQRLAAATRLVQSRYDLIISLSNMAYQGGQIEPYTERVLNTPIPDDPHAGETARNAPPSRRP